MIKQFFSGGAVGEVYKDFKLAKVTSFKIGGEASLYATPRTIDELFNLIEQAEENCVKYKIIGNGTNLVFSDEGFNGLVISTKILTELERFGERSFLVGAGVMLSTLTIRALNEGLSGLEFAVGIPGTLGGAIVMNAGANGGDISSVVKSVTVLENGGIRVLEKEKLEFGYRSSYFLSHPTSIILFAELELISFNEKEIIEQRMKQNLERRLLTQPKEPSAGCVFKKVGEKSAGQLIEEAGLKGFKVGGAEVSLVHANFIVNTGSATTKDVLKLIKIIKTEVYKKFGVELELEVEIIDR